jgi:hypothetical protein
LDTSQETLLSPNPLLHAVSAIELPLVDALRHRKPVQHDVMLPHQVWAYLYNADPKAFEGQLLPGGRQQVFFLVGGLGTVTFGFFKQTVVFLFCTHKPSSAGCIALAKASYDLPCSEI